jgi:predicted transcriptional regulator
MKDQKLTDAEKDLMEIIWQKSGFYEGYYGRISRTKPATTTIATLLKRMQNKDLIGYKTYGNSREYFPKVSKEVYFKEEMTSMIDKFFNSSASQFASFFTSNTKMSQTELKELRDLIDQKIKD